MNKPTRNLLDPEIQKCPFSFYAELRKEEPVRFMPEIGAYFIASYELGRKVLIDSKRFAKKTAEDDGRRYIEPSKAAQEILRTKDVGTPLSLMAQKEGAEHRAYRGIVNSYFQSGTVRKMEDYVTSIGNELLDSIGDAEDIEVVGAFSVQLPLYVIADILGIPKSEYLTFKKWSDATLTYTVLVVPEIEAIAGAELMVEMHRYILKEAHARRETPRDDLLSVLANAQYQGRPLTDRELCGFSDEILVAGNETTANAFSAGMLYLAQHPELQTKLREEPALITNFVEEVLRISTPLQITLRFSLVDVTVGGVAIPAGSKIFVGIGSANRDDGVFVGPERIDLSRGNVKAHVTFGAGEHHCLGAELARLELRIAFQLWLERYSNIELAQDPDSIVNPPSYAVRGPVSLKVRVKKAGVIAGV